MNTLFNNNGTQARTASLLWGTPARFVSQRVILTGMSDSVEGGGNRRGVGTCELTGIGRIIGIGIPHDFPYTFFLAKLE